VFSRYPATSCAGLLLPFEHPLLTSVRVERKSMPVKLGLGHKKHKEDKMKKILALILTAVLISILVIPVGAALADKDFHTIRLPLSPTEGHELRNGMVIRTHTEGPVNYLLMSYILNGAEPNTTYYICWEILEMGAIYPYTVYNEGEIIQTDKNGNGNLHVKFSPDVVGRNVYPEPTLHFRVLFIEENTWYTKTSMAPAYPGVWLIVGGDVVYETGAPEEYFEVDMDWDWYNP